MQLSFIFLLTLFSSNNATCSLSKISLSLIFARVSLIMSFLMLSISKVILKSFESFERKTFISRHWQVLKFFLTILLMQALRPVATFFEIKLALSMDFLLSRFAPKLMTLPNLFKLPVSLPLFVKLGPGRTINQYVRYLCANHLLGFAYRHFTKRIEPTSDRLIDSQKVLDSLVLSSLIHFADDIVEQLWFLR